MRKTVYTCRIRLIFLLIGFLFVGCTNNDKKDALILATYTYATNNRIENLKPLAEELEKALKLPVRVKSYPNVSAFIEGIKANQVDIAFINTLGYLLLSMDSTQMLPMATLKLKEEARDNYKTVLLSNNESVSDSISLKHQAPELLMTFVSQGSTSGNLIPRLYLSSIGMESPEREFKKVSYGGNHTSTFNKLKNRETDICAIGSNEYFQQLQKDTSHFKSIKVLWISEEIPLGPILVNTNVPKSKRQKMEELLMTLHESNPSAFNSIKAGWSEAKQTDRFHKISDEYYDNFRKVNGNGTHLSEILSAFKVD